MVQHLIDVYEMPKDRNHGELLDVLRLLFTADQRMT